MRSKSENIILGVQFDEATENKTRAEKALAEFKQTEKKLTLHTKKIGRNTIVCCKNKDRFEEYEKLYQFSNIVI